MSDVTIRVGAEDSATAVLSRVQASVSQLPIKVAAVGAAFVSFNAVNDAFADGFRFTISALTEANERIDSLGDSAANLDETTSALSAFNAVAMVLGGLDTGQALASLEKMRTTLGGILEGQNQTGADTLQRLGLNIDELSTQGPVDAFKAIQEAIGALPNALERAAVAQSIFGRGAKDVLALLEQDAEQMLAIESYARSVGAVITDDMGAAVGSMNEEFDRSKLALQGLGNITLTAVAPAIESVAAAINSVAPAISEVVEVYLPQLVDGTALVAGNLVDAAESMGVFSTVTNMALQQVQALNNVTSFFGGSLGEVKPGGTAETWLAQLEATRERYKLEAEANREKLQADREAEATLGRMKGIQDAISESWNAFNDAQAEDLKEWAALEKDILQAVRDAAREQERKIQKEADDKLKREEDRQQRIREGLMMNVDGLQASQGRLLTQGTTAGPFEKLIGEAQRQTKAADKAAAALEEINEREKRRVGQFDVYAVTIP